MPKFTFKDTIVKVQDLPQTIQSFLAAHFSNTGVAAAIKDGSEYEVPASVSRKLMTD